MIFMVYCAIAATLYGAQDALIFQASNSDAPLPEVLEYLPGITSLREDPPAVVQAPRIDAPRGTILLFHGNAGQALDRTVLYPHFEQRGLRLVIAQYPGYGWHAGSPSEATMVDAGKRLYTQLRAETPPGHPVFIAGESLGSGVAARVAAEASVTPERLILITPYLTFLEVVEDKFPIMPVGLLLRHRFETARHLDGYSGKVAVLVADQDEVVGAETGFATHAAAPAGSALVVIKGGRHNNWHVRLSDTMWNDLLGPEFQTNIEKKTSEVQS